MSHHRYREAPRAIASQFLIRREAIPQIRECIDALVRVNFVGGIGPALLQKSRIGELGSGHTSGPRVDWRSCLDRDGGAAE